MRNAGQVEKEKLHDPLEALRYQKVLLENLRMLEDINQELSTAKAELASLINLPPGTQFRVEVPTEAMKIRPWSMSIERMEDLAFINNPDLREQVYQTRISVDETRKAILKLLPGITFDASRNYDSNTFLQNNMWNEASAKLSFNLLNLISGPSQIMYANANEDATDARRIALRMAVLAEVHVSRLQYESAARQFDLADYLAEVEKKLAHTMATRQESDAQSIQERINAQASYIASELRRYQTYARAQAMLGKMQATIGADFVPEQVDAHNIDALSNGLSARLEEYDLGNIPASVQPLPSAAESAPQDNASVPQKQDQGNMAVVAPAPVSDPVPQAAAFRSSEPPKPATSTTALNTGELSGTYERFKDVFKLIHVSVETPPNPSLPAVNGNFNANHKDSDTDSSPDKSAGAAAQ